MSAEGSTVRSCNFFKEINSNGFFDVSEHSQYDLLYLQLSRELFLYRRQSVFPFQELSFGLRLGVANPCLFHLQTFLTKIYFSVPITYSSINFTWFARLKNLMKDLCSNLKHSVWFAAILNRLKTNISVRWNNFSYKQRKVYIHGKIYYFPFVLKKEREFLLFIEWPTYKRQFQPFSNCFATHQLVYF